MVRGTRVRLLRGPMGLLEDEQGHRFAEPVARKGDEAIYWGAHLSIPEWEMVKVGDYFCPVHITDIEEITA